MKSFAQTNFNNAEANPANTSRHIYDINGQEITEVVLPTGTKKIGKNAFNGCQYITSIEMPATTATINDDIFMDCSALRDVYCAAEDVPAFIGVNDPSAMDGVFQNATLHVPFSSLYDYKADSWWKRFGTVVGLDGESEVYVTDISLSQTSATMITYDTLQLTATITPSNATNKSVTWSSSDESVATVDSNGLVTALTAGEAVITATATDGSGVKAECFVTVQEAPTLNVAADPVNGSILTELNTINITLTDYAADDWDTPTVTVKDYTIKVMKDGEQVATATIEGDYDIFNLSHMTLSETLTEKGAYTIVVPEGVFVDSNSDPLPGFTLVYSIGTPTGVNSAKADAAKGKDVIYDLNGLRVSGKLPAGIYIVNGKKVVVK